MILLANFRIIRPFDRFGEKRVYERREEMSIPAIGRIQHLHFVGIGGSGMCGIAEVLLNEGYRVSGSDLNESIATKRLSKLGAQIAIGHNEAHIQHADVVVRSTAITDDNPEIEAARAQRIPIVARAEMLAELMRFRYGIAVAGTHGKTTTTSLVSSILAEGGFDPTFVIGGLLNSTGCNARLGASKYLVAEADESDASFLYLKPMISVVTNIDQDHMQTYENDFNLLKATFLQFLHHLPFYGLAVLCSDDPTIKELLPEISRSFLTYGLQDDADFQAYDYQQKGIVSNFSVRRPGKDQDLHLTMKLPGIHNVLNATAAIAIATELGIDDETISHALASFSGIGRRFHIYGEHEIANKSFTLVDDYGHHPRELAATMAAARQAWPDKRLVMIFQPHRYTRTQELFDDFSQVLTQVDELMLLDVYPAGEEPIPGADTPALCRNIRARGGVEPLYVKPESLQDVLKNVIHTGDIVLAQGAGNIGAIAADLHNELKKN